MMRFLKFFIFIFFAATTNFIISGENKSVVWTVYFENIKGMEVPLYCEVASAEEEKKRGLMFREKLESNECMVFTYDTPILLSFWMKNTLIPLSIAFLDEQQKIIDIFDMKPRDETIISSTLPGRYAIEVNRGWFNKNYVYHGSKARFVKKDMRAEKLPKEVK